MIVDLCPICGNTIPPGKTNCPQCGIKRPETGENTKKQSSFPVFLIAFIFLLIAGIIFIPNYLQPPRSGRYFTACQSNCKNIGTALEMYATDHQGHYPTSLHELISGGYLKKIPECPAANHDTYSASYTSSTGPDTYTFFCEGRNHMKITGNKDYPQYNSSQGLIPQP